MTDAIPGRPQTMAEYIQRRARLLMWLQRVALAVFAGAGIAMAFAHWDANIGILLLIVVGIGALKLAQVIGDTVRCPPCGNKLDPRAFRGEGEPTVRSCPKCGADFSQPMPQKPINPIS